jgi:Tfp pilus assembly pilus retraction ATPase PilT
MIDWLNTTYDHHIITIEDPIEYYHNHKKSIITQREVGVDVPTFAEALRRALRQDPDVILVGEMRDLETIEAAVTAAGNGPPGVRHAAHHRRRAHRRPTRRRLPHEPAGADPHPACR